ncbi:excalibur calcium-binding domain-containing protein [Sphingomonas panacisoli]|uniref:Excalibur calcium-binding domain-containing protein n=1 Tax=Sphingomonas panacisoli TaxID=1813879 RepID=A0A5B8LEY4_9SPHN|nr:excalibur calcium-binding domain-containing protein [Sphingomonas panacisoli]QDZ06429.1 excalibur calcium-binding domain-containing protein [Sphingomonas panacisoli]
MGFKKPFRAQPVRLGKHYRREARRKTIVTLTRAAVFGMALAAASIVFERPARLAWRGLTESPTATAARENSVYYAGCDEARRAGAAPIYKGEPGYRPEMDGDNDGIACEPYRR